MKDIPTTYIVSGYMRTGTSMMMHALKEGGMELVVDKSREKMNTTYGDNVYKPNHNGFFELTPDTTKKESFPEMFFGKTMKILPPDIFNICDGNYKVLIMQRDKEEARQSYEAFFKNYNVYFDYEGEMKKLEKFCKERDDIDYLILQYKDVVFNPKKAFGKIKEFGIPIDVEKSIKVIDPNKYRFRIERLIPGI